MSAVDLFLAQQKRFRCERLSADLTQEQCKANQKRTPEIFQCQDCAGLGKAVEMEARMAEAKCECGEKVFASGQCRSCYDKAAYARRKAKKAVQVEDVDPAAIVKSPPTVKKLIELDNKKRNPLLVDPTFDRHVLLDLREHPGLYDWIQEEGVTMDNIIELLAQCYMGRVFTRLT